MRLRAVFLAFAFCVGTVAVRADSFHWSFSVQCGHCGPFVNGAGMPVNFGGEAVTLFVQEGGVLTTTDVPVNGALTITGISGTRTTNWYAGYYLYPAETNSITGLIPADPTNPLGLTLPTDNLLYPNGNPLIDSHGFAFTLNCTYCGDYGPGGSFKSVGKVPVCTLNYASVVLAAYLR